MDCDLKEGSSSNFHLSQASVIIVQLIDVRICPLSKTQRLPFGGTIAHSYDKGSYDQDPHPSIATTFAVLRRVLQRFQRERSAQEGFLSNSNQLGGLLAK